MKRIVFHWTAGNYKPNATEKKSYHYLVDDKGKIHNGTHKPEDNENCNDGDYAAHTGGGNTGSIGIAVCSMFGYVSPSDVGKYPITLLQIEAMFKLAAQLCRKYNIPITPETVLTHYEFGVRNPKTTSKGKIDITYLPPYPRVTRSEMGNFIRQKVKWYYSKL